MHEVLFYLCTAVEQDFKEKEFSMVWPLIIGFARTYATYLVWPVAAAIGFVGYNLEWAIRGDGQMPGKVQSIAEERDMRLLQEIQNKDLTEVDKLKNKTFVPKTIFERHQ